MVPSFKHRCRAGCIAMMILMTAMLVLIYEERLRHFLIQDDSLLDTDDKLTVDDDDDDNDVTPKYDDNYDNVTPKDVDDVIPQYDDDDNDDAVDEADTMTTTSMPASNKVKTFIRHYFLGRLGNVLFQYAAIYCMAKQNRALPFFGNMSLLHYLQDPGRLYSKEENAAFVRGRYILERFCCSFDKRFQTLAPDRNYTILGYLQSWKYFESCKQDIMKIFTFKEEFVRKAETTLKVLQRRFPGKVMIGVHVRMGDHTRPGAVINGKRVATPSYFLSAMNYFRRRFSDVLFVVFASSDAWWKDNIPPFRDVTFHNRSHPAVDMEVLSRLDHIIISVGTFGWWAAYRNKGTVVFFKDFYSPGSHFGRQFLNNETDYIYPGWIRM